MYRFFPFWLGLLLLSLVACGFAPGSTATTPNDTSLLSERTPNPRMSGDANAPVKIIEFSDYQ